MAVDSNFSGSAAITPWPPLVPGETLCWEGRPAPRCYTFRHWRHALFGLGLTLLCAGWEWLGLQQMAEQGWLWLAWVPLPFLVYALWLAGGQLLAARLEWNRVAYAITSRRVVVRGGLLRMRQAELPLERVTWFRLQPYGEALGTLRIHGGPDDPVLILHCVEYPHQPAEWLEKVIRARNP